MSPRRWLYAAGIAILALALLFGVQRCTNRGDVIPPKLAVQIDSLKRTRLADSVEKAQLSRDRDAALARAASAEKSAATHGAASTAAQGRASVAGADATRLATLAATAETAQDSAAHYRAAYEARTRENGDLEVALTEERARSHDLDSARAETVHALFAESAARVKAEARLAVIENTTLPRLESAAKAAEKPCKLLGLVRCPSRTVVAVGSAVLTLVVVKEGRQIAKTARGQ